MHLQSSKKLKYHWRCCVIKMKKNTSACTLVLSSSGQVIFSELSASTMFFAISIIPLQKISWNFKKYFYKTNKSNLAPNCIQRSIYGCCIILLGKLAATFLRETTNVSVFGGTTEFLHSFEHASCLVSIVLHLAAPR